MWRIGSTNAQADAGQTKSAKASHKALWYKDIAKNWPLYIMVLPALVAILIFGYGPLFGLVIAFQDYSAFRGITGSEWVGLDNFREAFRNPYFRNALQNSIIISGLKLAIGFPSAIILALLLNEVRVQWFKRTVQTATILPFFISWVVIATMFRNLLAPDGVVNEILQYGLAMEPIIFLSDPVKFRWIIVLQDTWKYVGYFAVLYLAAMAAIDTALYEAATVDGANRWQQTLHVTIPGITSTMVTLFILLSGYLIFAGWEQIIVMYNVAVYSTADILETLTLRLGLNQGRYGLATAIGLFQSIIGLALVLFSNFLAKRIKGEGLF